MCFVLIRVVKSKDTSCIGSLFLGDNSPSAGGDTRSKAIDRVGYAPFLRNALLLMLIFCIISPISLKAQTLSYAKSFKNSYGFGGLSSGKSIAADSLGNIYVTGSFMGMADFDPGPGQANLISVGKTDVYFAKYDQSGKYVYAKALGGAGDEYGNAIAIDGLGNVYVTGYFEGTADFDPGAGTAYLSSAGNNDIFIAKYNPSGSLIYAKAIGGAGNEYGNGIAVDKSGNAVITGSFDATADFDPGDANALLNCAGGTDIFIARYDAFGSYVYAKGFGGTGNDQGSGIAIDNTGAIAITGWFVGTIDLDPGAGVSEMVAAGGEDIFIAKYDSLGNHILSRNYGTGRSDRGYGVAMDAFGNIDITGCIDQSNISIQAWNVFLARYDIYGNLKFTVSYGGAGHDIGFGIATDRKGNIFITGYFNGIIDFDPSFSQAMLNSADQDATFIAKYDSSGNYIYARVEKGNGNGIAVDNSGNSYTTGFFTNYGDFDPGPDVFLLHTGGDKENAFISTLDPAGNYIRAAQLGNLIYDPLNEVVKGIAVDKAGNIYVTGTFAGPVDFNPGIGVATLNSTLNSRDVFIAKYDLSGNYLFAKIIGGLYADNVSSITLDESGNIYITGPLFGSPDFDPGPGTAILPGTDALFFAKYDASGNYIYAKSIPARSEGLSIATDIAGNTILTGHFSGAVDFDPGMNVHQLTSNGTSEDIFIAKYDPAGNYIFANGFGNTGIDIGSAIETDAIGNIYITGSFLNTVDFDPGPGISTITSTINSYDIFIAKYDALGNFVYAKSMGRDFSSSGLSVAVSKSGHAYVTGYLGLNVDSKRFHEIFISKYDPSGSLEFSKILSGDSVLSQGNGLSIKLDSAENIYVTGSFSSIVDFDPGPGTHTLTAAGGSDIFFAKYDSGGNYLYANDYGGVGDDVGNSIAIDALNNVYLTGSFTGTVNFDPATGNSNSTIASSNGADIFILQFATANILPINLIMFSAKPLATGKAVQLAWTTASQTSNAYFEVERSTNGMEFQSLGRVQGCGSCASMKEYRLVDNNPLNGISYYRLKQVDIDNKFSYSQVVTVSFAIRENLSLRIFPTVTGDEFNITIQNASAKKQVKVELINSDGRLISNKSPWLNEGDNTIRYSLINEAAGVYYLRLVDKETGKSVMTKVIKR